MLKLGQSRRDPSSSTLIVPQSSNQRNQQNESGNTRVAESSPVANSPSLPESNLPKLPHGIQEIEVSLHGSENDFLAASRSTEHGNGSLHSEDKIITISLGRLQQRLIEFCAQVLREDVTALPHHRDIEPSTSHQENNSLFGAELSYYLVHQDDTKREIIENIWNSDSPLPLSSLIVPFEEDLDPGGLLDRCRRNEELYQLFRSPHQTLEQPILDGRILAWHVNKGRQGSTEAIMFGLIICCCLAAKQGNITIGNILRFCYGIGILRRPAGKTAADYLDHCLLVVECSLAMNRIYQLEPLLMYEDKGWKLELCGRKRMEDLLNKKDTAEEMLAMDISKLFQVLHMLNHKPSSLDTATGPAFRIDDLNTSSLRSIGRLHIRWTVSVENHLLLDLDTMTLSIAWSPLPREESIVGTWQCLFLKRLPLTFLDSTKCQERELLGEIKEKSFNKELEQTWAFLFATHTSEQKRYSSYRRLISPPWASEGAPTWLETLQMGKLRPDMDSAYNRVLDAALSTDSISYSQFPIFEKRLRQLRHHMDNQKPRGFRQLWNDRRDSLTYYTFWGVIVLGIITILLALASLAVGIAQAVASFRALKSG